jgi:hypothetical protein
MSAVPNNFTFSLQDVVSVVGSAGNQASAVASAIALCYDPAYTSEVGLRRFRNYDTSRGMFLFISPTSHAGAGTFTVTVTANAENVWTATTGSYGTWIHISGGGPKSGSGTFSVTVDAGGTLSGSIAITSMAATVSMPISR